MCDVYYTYDTRSERAEAISGAGFLKLLCAGSFSSAVKEHGSQQGGQDFGGSPGDGC